MNPTTSIAVRWVGTAGEHELNMTVPAGTTLAQALALLRSERGSPAVAAAIWGKLRKPEYVLREGDRIECLEPLRVDPKTARRTKAAMR